MKKAFIITGILIAMTVGVITILVMTKPKATTVASIGTVTNPVVTENQSFTGTHCFAYHQVATKDAPYTVDEYLTLTLNGTQVVGIKKGNQSGPDMTNGYEGNLTGTMTGDTVTVNYVYTVEGSKNREQEI